MASTPAARLVSGDPLRRQIPQDRRTPVRSFEAHLVVMALVLTLVVVAPTSAQDDGESDPSIEQLRAEQADVRSERAVQAASIDVIEAEQDEVLAALDAINQDVHLSEARLAAAEQELTAAEWQSTSARLRAADAQADIELLEARVRENAVASYIRTPSAELQVALEAEDPNDAAARRVLIDSEFGRSADNLDALRARRDDLVRAERETVEAERLATAVQAQQVELLTAARAAQERQYAFEDEVEGRLDAALAEAASLSALDEEFGNQIAAEQTAIAQRLADERARAVRVAEEARRAAEAESEADRRADETAATPSTRVSSGSSGRARLSTAAGTMESVRGIWVHESIADSVEAMLAAAAADGIRLSGGGYRDPADQIRLRRAHCGTSNYAIYEMRASSCRPPTARPGRSMHEQGKAIDVTHNGRIITSRSNPGFLWLRENAARFGLENLPSEPWHWSVNGR